MPPDRDALPQNQMKIGRKPLLSHESKNCRAGVYSGWKGAKIVDRPATKSAVSSNREKKKVRSTNRSLVRILHGADYGIDYLHLAFMIYEPNQDSDRWEKLSIVRQDRSFTRRKILISPAPEMITLYTYTSGSGYKCALEFNPARIVNALGIGLCSVNDLRAVVEEVMRMAAQYVEPLVDIDDFDVRRIDVARNFYDVALPQRYLYGLYNVPRPYARDVDLHLGSSGIPETLVAGSKSSGCVRLYDKFIESPVLKSYHRTPPGTMRAEVEARVRWCQEYGGMYRFEDITEDAINRLTADRMINWFGLQAEVTTFENARKQILFDEDLDVRRRVGLMRYLWDVEEGRPPTLSAKSVNGYKRLLRERGIGPLRVEDQDSLTTRLDFESGAEIQIA